MGQCEGPCSNEGGEKVGVREFLRKKIFTSKHVIGEESVDRGCEGPYTKEEECITDLCKETGEFFYVIEVNNIFFKKFICQAPLLGCM